MIFSFITLRLLDILDIFLVAVLMYQLYRLIRGTVALNIFFGIVAFYLIWVAVNSLHMDLLSKILGQFIGVGVIALIIVFQQEIRRFLLLIGTRYITSSKQRFKLHSLLHNDIATTTKSDVDEIINALFEMAKTKTGALIVFSPHSDLKTFAQNGEALDAAINSHLLQCIFYKNSPLHDGALIISGNRITAAKCVLPSSERSDLPVHYGMRHRSAIGMSEETNALILVVSEQSGTISYCQKGALSQVSSADELRKILNTHIQNSTL